MNLKEQREKILSGQMYNDLTNELVKAREDAVYLTNEYNASYGKPTKERETILKNFLNPLEKAFISNLIFVVNFATTLQLEIIFMPILIALCLMVVALKLVITYY